MSGLLHSRHMTKRSVDTLLCLLAISLLWPLLGAIAIAVLLESGRPAMFRQRRAGYLGRPFVLLKFRTMWQTATAYGRSPAGPQDARLTRVGRFLRENSLDELPQLFSILAGTMSLVGPRPLYERQAAQWDARQRRRLDVLPGLTGWAQVTGGRADLPIEDKIELDLWYVEHQSLRLDLSIIARTIRQTLSRGGNVYEKRYSREQQREILKDATAEE